MAAIQVALMIGASVGGGLITITGITGPVAGGAVILTVAALHTHHALKPRASA